MSRRRNRKGVLITNRKLKRSSWVQESSLPVWLDRGWTRVDDKKSEPADHGASQKEKK